MCVLECVCACVCVSVREGMSFRETVRKSQTVREGMALGMRMVPLAHKFEYLVPNPIVQLVELFGKD